MKIISSKMKNWLFLFEDLNDKIELNISNKSFPPKRKSQTETKRPNMRQTRTRRIAGLNIHLLGGVPKEQEYWVTYHDIPEEL
jgi:hypothetical protein